MHELQDAPPRVSPLTRIGVVLPAFAAGIAALIGSRPLDDNSFLTHLATGRLILDSGFPHHDPYTFTAGGEPWVVQSWFASVLYAVSEELGGLDGIRILNGVLAGLVGLVAWRLTARAGSPLARMLAWAPIAVVGTGYWGERPLLLGLLFLGVTLLVAEGDVDRRWLVPIGWLWVNSHGSWPLGLVALAAIAIGHRLDGDAEPCARTLNAGRWLLGGIALGAVNPYGPRLLLFPLDLLSRQEQLRTIVEWQAPTFEAIDERAFLVVLALGIVALCRVPKWRAAVPLALFAAAALVGARNLPITSLVVLPGLAVGLQGLGSATVAAAATGRSRRGGAVLVAAAIAGAVVVGGTGKPPIELRRYPIAVTNWLEDHDLDPRTTRIAAPELVGNFWELRYGADADVFVDDRMEVLPAAVVADHLSLVRGRDGWDEALDRYEIEVVVWPQGAALTELLALDEGWELVHTDEPYVVYARA